MSQEYLYVVALAQYVGVSGVSDQPYQPGPGGRMFAYAQGVVNGPIRRSVFFCPSEQWQPADPVTSSMQWMGFTSYGTCYYGWNPSADGATNCDYIPTNANVFPSNTNYWMSKRLSRMKTSSNVGVFAHIVAYDHFTYLEVGRLTDWVNFSYNLEPNHLNTLPVAFLDGHVDAFHWTDLQDPMSFGPTSSTPLWYKMNFP
jgi:prepilin-type processing-associated H-X9-DG protein